MRLVRTIAAAALAVGLTTSLAPVALAAGPSTVAPTHSASAHHSKKPVKAKHAKDQVKLDLRTAHSATAGDTLTLTGKLTHRTTKGYKPVVGKAVVLSLVDAAGATVLSEATTTAKGGYTLTFATTADQAGTSARLATTFAGDTSLKAATSKVITVQLEAPDAGDGDGTGDGGGTGDGDGTGGGTGDGDGTGGGQQQGRHR